MCGRARAQLSNSFQSWTNLESEPEASATLFASMSGKRLDSRQLSSLNRVLTGNSSLEEQLNAAKASFEERCKRAQEKNEFELLNMVFIVRGHDEGAREKVAPFLKDRLGTHYSE